jgi:hypothetical protein
MSKLFLERGKKIVSEEGDILGVFAVSRKDPLVLSVDSGKLVILTYAEFKLKYSMFDLSELDAAVVAELV